MLNITTIEAHLTAAAGHLEFAHLTPAADVRHDLARKAIAEADAILDGTQTDTIRFMDERSEARSLRFEASSLLAI